MLYDVLYNYFITVKCLYIYSILFLFISFISFIYLFFLFFFFYVIFSQGITRMNCSGAVVDILVFTYTNLSDNTVYTENRKYSSSSSSTSTSTSTGTSISTSTSSTSI